MYVTDPPVPQFERMAVNLLDENESNLLPVTNAAPGHLGTVAASNADAQPVGMVVVARRVRRCTAALDRMVRLHAAGVSVGAKPLRVAGPYAGRGVTQRRHGPQAARLN